MKQLLSIDRNNVRRFRFECFLMKNLRHPNIVKLVGVCWDDSLFGCCLEYVRARERSERASEASGRAGE
jgi:hypothetical protein